MKFLTALSLSIAGLAGLATFLAVGPLSGIFFIWAATIAWAAYFALGGDCDAASNTVVCGLLGIFMAWYAAVLISDISPTAALGFPLMAAIIVTVTVALMCLAANIKLFATIPASVLGYSATFAYLLQTPDKLQKEFLTGHSWDNPLIVVSVSFIVGIGFAIASNKLATSLTTVSDD
ncbi:MAG: DUF1097 domain-containing protein [Methylococcaceae bacterium]|jgi:hypothetical protein|nr:DUF1097 domain-containing protein [Methylococcaceae bacterium]